MVKLEKKKKTKRPVEAVIAEAKNAVAEPAKVRKLDWRHEDVFVQNRVVTVSE